MKTSLNIFDEWTIDNFIHGQSMYHPFSFPFFFFFLSRKLRFLPQISGSRDMHRRRLSPINRPRIELKRLSKLNEIRQRLNDQLSRWSVDKGIRLWSSITTRFRTNRRWINGTRVRIKPLFWLIVGESLTEFKFMSICIIGICIYSLKETVR